MKILIDAHMVGQNEGGNERYMKNITLALAKIAHVGVITYSHVKEFSHIRQHILPNNDLWRLLYVPFLMKKYGYTHYFSTYICPPYKLSDAHYVIALHDVYFARSKSAYSIKDKLLLNTLVPHSIKLANTLITPSFFTQKELKSILPKIQGKTQVIYCGVDTTLLLKSNNQRKKLILVIVSKNPRKNVDLALQSFIQSGLSDHTLIIVGNTTFSLNTYNNKNIHIRGYVSDLEMKKLYASSACLLYLSDYEGFGLPVIEALANRTPVIVLDSPINREISRNKATFVKKKDPIYIGNILRKSVTHKVPQAVARQIIKEFSWDKAAKQLLAVFKSV